MKRTVTLAGFGPGDPELLTLKAEKLLRRSDIIFYDDLIGAGFLRRYRAKKVYVGKRAGKPGLPQAAINELLYQAALRYRCVVRLKGGDPFVFGRGGEEMAFLEKRKIRVEIIPGVTAALAAAAAAKFPLTQRGLSSSVAFCVGHPESKIRVPAAETLVYYMAGSNLRAVARQCLEAGWPGKTPAAIVSCAGLKGQKVTFESLDGLARKTKRCALPLVLVIGKTVSKKCREALPEAIPCVP
ncbi:MAG: uroporphyrinogen-III C-methyltransferase [Candidatus Omnitrophota bacterium]|jgi:uroporphyrin-III C-methyltransferase